jgi:hypothetical protein
MRRFTSIVVCTLALVFCLAVVSTAQEFTSGHNGRSVSIAPGTGMSPSPNAVKPATAIPEGTTVIYSNFGSGDSYDGEVGWVETGVYQNFWYPYTQAMAFTPTKATYILKQLDLALSYWGVGPNAMTVELCGDADGVPGGVIASWYITGLPLFGSTSSIVQTIQVKKTIVLVRNHQYWLVPVPNVYEAAVWNWNSVGASGYAAIPEDGSPWYEDFYSPNGAFDVLGTVLPPTSGQ